MPIKRYHISKSGEMPQSPSALPQAKTDDIATPKQAAAPMLRRAQTAPIASSMSAAEQMSLYVLEHATGISTQNLQAFVEVATSNETLLAFRAPNLDSLPILRAGGVAKRSYIKPKSASASACKELGGELPSDQYNSKLADTLPPDVYRIEKGNKEIKSALDADYGHEANASSYESARLQRAQKKVMDAVERYIKDSINSNIRQHMDRYRARYKAEHMGQDPDEFLIRGEEIKEKGRYKKMVMGSPRSFLKLMPTMLASEGVRTAKGEAILQFMHKDAGYPHRINGKIQYLVQVDGKFYNVEDEIREAAIEMPPGFEVKPVEKLLEREIEVTGLGADGKPVVKLGPKRSIVADIDQFTFGLRSEVAEEDLKEARDIATISPDERLISTTAGHALTAALAFDTKENVNHGQESFNPFPEAISDIIFILPRDVSNEQELVICDSEPDVLDFLNSEVAQQFAFHINPLWGWRRNLENGKLEIDPHRYKSQDIAKLYGEIQTLRDPGAVKAADNALSALRDVGRCNVLPIWTENRAELVSKAEDGFQAALAELQKIVGRIKHRDASSNLDMGERFKSCRSSGLHSESRGRAGAISVR